MSGGTGTSPSASPSDEGMDGNVTLMGTDSPLLGGDAGDVQYPYHLVNGRVLADLALFRSKPGKRVRLRLINAGSDTAYRVAMGGQKAHPHPHRWLPRSATSRPMPC